MRFQDWLHPVRRGGKSLDGGNGRSDQAARWWLAMLDHVLGNRCLGHVNSELQQFRMQAGRSPEHVRGAHVSDQVSDFL